MEEAVELFFCGQWIDSDRLTAIVQASLPDGCKTGDTEEWIGNRVADKLQNWVDRGLIEKLGSQYRALKGLSEIKAHLAAKHCGELLDLVRRPVRKA